MSAAIAPTGEAALSNQVDVPFRVTIPNDNVADFFELERIYSELSQLATTLPTPAPTSAPSESSSGSGPLSSSTPPSSAADSASLPTLRVALQIPDEFLFTSDSIVSTLTSLHTASSVASFHLDPFVLADTQYSPCCVDEVAAMHFSANCVVHFGRSCLSGVSHMPVLYAFGKLPLDVEHAVKSLRDCAPEDKQSKVLVVYDVTYAWTMPAIKRALGEEACAKYVFADVIAESGANDGKHAIGFTSFKRCVPAKDDVPYEWPVVVVGPPGPLVAHYSLVFNQHPLHHYNPLDSSLSSPRSTLMKRYALMQKARDASVIGIVVGTLGVANYLSTIATIKRLIRAHHKKYYTFVLGKLNVPKLANFMDIDVFVLVACPESSLIDSKEFYKPMVTPFELGMALDLNSEWTGEYRLAFSEVNGWMAEKTAELVAQDGDQDGAAREEQDDDDDSPYFSLVTGTYVQRAKITNNAEIHEQIKDLTLRDDASMQLALQSPAAQRLAQKSWKGLDTSVPREEKSMKVVEGRFGNAAGYCDEPGKE